MWRLAIRTRSVVVGGGATRSRAVWSRPWRRLTTTEGVQAAPPEETVPVQPSPRATLPSNLKLAEESMPREALRWRKEPEAKMPVSELLKDPRVPVVSLFGEDREMTLPWRVFREPLRYDLLENYVKWQRANWRQIHRAAKTRGEKRGSNRKIYQQKGTGRARMGMNRSPSRKGSGKAHGPTRRNFSEKLPKQQRQMAMRVVVSQKLRENRLIVLDKMTTDEISTKKLYAALKAKNLHEDCLFVFRGNERGHMTTDDANNEFYLSIRNIPNIDFKPQIHASVYSILYHEFLVMTPDAIAALCDRIQPRSRRIWPSLDDMHVAGLLPPVHPDLLPALNPTPPIPLDDASSSSSSSSSSS